MTDINQAWYEYEEALKRFNAAEADFEKAMWNLRHARQMIEAIPSWSEIHRPSPFPLATTAQTKPWPGHPTGDKAENYPYCGKG